VAGAGVIAPSLFLRYVDESTADYSPDDSDDELYEPLMDDNESNAISDLLVYLENVPHHRLRNLHLLFHGRKTC